MNTERLFQTHEVRRQYSLDGMWEFQALESPRLPEAYRDTISVPSCWEMVMPYCRHRGYAAYRRKVVLNKKENLRFLFKGISHSGTVYFDKKEVGFHYNAYTPFSVVVPDAAAGEHELEIIVDNRFSEDSKLHIPNDYYTYGGITRSAFLEKVSECYIERMEFEPCYQNGGWMARIRVFIRNISGSPVEVCAAVSCAGSRISGNITAESGQETMAEFCMKFTDVSEWSAETPSLYLLNAVLMKDEVPVDDLTDRIGFRIVAQEKGKILINGKPVFMKGVNRHEDHGLSGCSLPLPLMDADMKLIKDMGANAVRTCHYPNDELFLDLCDENGLLVWEESHDRGGDAERITHPRFIEQSMEVMREMLQYHYNHPSIIIWACLNEAASDCEEGAAVFKQHMDYLAKDKTRLITYASNKSSTDICLDMADVCSFNMYPLWYNDATPEDELGKLRNRMSETGNAGKPIIISEFGGGAIYNFHDVMRVKWSEEFQADLLQEVISDFLGQEDLSGIFIWQFCDVRISQEGNRNWPMTRPKSRNNKGLVDEFRRPKQAYYTVKELYRGI